MGKKFTPEEIYKDAEIELYEIEDATIAVRNFGKGHPLVFIHGYPVNGYTWRKLIPVLSKNFQCIVIDLPGLGDSNWTTKTNFSFTAQARRINLLLEEMGVTEFSMVAHDTGATLARMVAIERGKDVKKLVLFNTEMPGHRPPYIPLYQKMAKIPGSALLCLFVLHSKPFVQSQFGFGQFYKNKALFNDPQYLQPYIDRFDSIEKVQGALSYQDGIEWKVIDALKEKHALIKADVLLLWGEDDKTFPVDIAEKMTAQFRSEVKLEKLPAALMPHEEVPEEALKHITKFLEEVKVAEAR